MALFQASGAQSSLEYLMTYGWALVLIAAVVGVLVFIASSPASEVYFSSSDPTKILIKGGAVQGSDVEVRVQNVTGGALNITGISQTWYSGCTANGSSPPLSVGAGAEIVLECTSSSNGTGAITLAYTDFAGLQRTAVINGRDPGSSGTQSQLLAHYNTGDNGSGLLYGSNWRAQSYWASFGPTDTYKITSVKLKLYREGLPGTITASIRNIGIPSGNPLAPDITGCAGTTEGNTLTTDPNNAEWREIGFGSDCIVTGYPGSGGYYVVARAPAGTIGNSVHWRLESTGGYTGWAKASSDGGASWTPLESDHMFEEWGLPPGTF